MPVPATPTKCRRFAGSSTSGPRSGMARILPSAPSRRTRRFDDDAPRAQFFVERAPGVRRTRGRQARERERALAEAAGDVTAEARFCGRTVEVDPSDARVLAQERGEVVRAQRRALDARVEAALAYARLQHVPHRDARVLERAYASRV